MMFGSNRVHIIVATAFIGCHDSKKDVVDHIDTNRCNNRSENLRWVTKLENALSNPITRKRIEYLCGGDINKFIEDPSCLQDITGNYQNVMWMRTVNKEEAKATYQRVMEWTQKNSSNKDVGIGEWIFETPYQQKEYLQETQNLLPAMLPITAMQRNWKTPTEFPLCPSEIDNKSLISYLNNLKIGSIVAKNKYMISIIDDFALCNDNSIIIRCHIKDVKDGVKEYATITITSENEKYIHEGITFFEEQGAKKAFTLAQGEKWEGEEGIDDYC